nr:peptidyl tRNA hydrolase PTRHD1 [Hymenolepis microstoma]
MSAQNLVQYIIIRTDLKASLSWSIGSVIAQACHASTAALHRYTETEETKAYVSDLDHMTKVILGVPDEVQLAKLAEKLENGNIDFVLWREKPENILTAIALRPYNRKDVKKLLSECSLYT